MKTSSSFLRITLLFALTIFATAYFPEKDSLNVEDTTVKIERIKPQVIGIKRLENTILPATGVGDNWYMTWAADDKQYTGLCDGPGFKGLPDYTGTSYNSKLYRIEGNPPDHKFEPVPAYPALESIHPSKIPGSKDYSRYYGFGILAVEKRIYQLMSTPKFPFGPEGNGLLEENLFTLPITGKHGTIRMVQRR